MPIRIIRESVCANELLDRLTAEEERCWSRLRTACDDYGRFDGRAGVVLGRCFPLLAAGHQVTAASVEQWLQGMASKNVILLYTANGIRYLQMLVWDQTPRAKESKYPPHGHVTGMPTPGAERGTVPAETSGVVTGMPTPGTEQGAAPVRTPAAQAPDKPLNWAKWYNDKFGICPSGTELGQMDELQKTGITDELIVECIQLAIREKARRPIGLARSTIASAVPYGVKTLADWVKHKADQQAPPGGGADPPPEEDEPDGISRRVARQREQLGAERAS